MMKEWEMKVDVREAIASITRHTTQTLPKQQAFATRVALTRTAHLAAQAEQREMRDVFRNPTPYTLSGVAVRGATAQRLSAEVKLKDDATKATPASKFLAPQVRGGLRGQKRFERALQAVGAMPAGFRAVPGSGARLDAYGNMSRGQIVQILSYFQAFPEMGYRANTTAARREALARGTKRQQGYVYFAGSPGDRLPRGIWQRVQFARGTAVRPVVIFVRSAVYQERFDFEYVAQLTVEREFAGQFAKAWIEAQETAR
ncbi:hypothetical protein [Massilia endophytica]|uniref:hypothetical protein n=1 Tax=Massilia endophytica TaxID=2899220 RepID=UPI001E5BBCCA|nr:hypothetical protein [Massilia endophytica]UGQ45091.1 hypothetical protein LSQ66_14960 [Massilia endophytica]